METKSELVNGHGSMCLAGGAEGAPDQEQTAIGRIRRYLGDNRGIDYSETFYSSSYSADRIRSAHNGLLCRAELARLVDDTVLVVVPEWYRIDEAQLLEQAHSIDEAEPSTGGEHLPRVFADVALLRCEDFSFFDTTNNAVLHLRKRDFQRHMRPFFAPIGVRERPHHYIAKMSDIAPVSAGHHLPDQKRCFIGISLENPKFEQPELLGATVAWINERFSECEVIVADTIHRLTRQIVSPGIGEVEALRQAMAIGDRFIHEKAPIFAAHRDCRFRIRRMSEKQYASEWLQRTEQLWALCETNEAYAREIRKFATRFVRRQDTSLAGRHPIEVELQLASIYIIEEAAYCAWMVHRGWPVLVYPGPLDPFKVVCDGKIPDAPEHLRKLQLVSLKLKRKYFPGEKLIESKRGQSANAG